MSGMGGRSWRVSLKASPRAAVAARCRTGCGALQTRMLASAATLVQSVLWILQKAASYDDKHELHAGGLFAFLLMRSIKFSSDATAYTALRGKLATLPHVATENACTLYHSPTQLQ